MRLKDKVCLITGGAAGIGKATAQRFAEEGAIVVVCDVNREAGEALVRELGEPACFYAVNVADRGEVQAWVEDVVRRFGRVDVLIN
ncbi:MAG: SDR family NAD(P)-dependent oxidoreductase, partial [Bellilinea sp.]|nr:SDR family NAD(P)-dependent oxidoreductase [Bellilinea sp.]